MRPLPDLRRESLDDERRALYDAITSGARAIAAYPTGGTDGSLGSIWNVWLYHPTFGRAFHLFGDAIRDQQGAALSPRARELLNLVVSAAEDSEVMWYFHVTHARRAGLTEDEIEVIRRQAPLALEDPVDRVVVDATRALVDDGDLPDDLYMRCESVLGAAGTVELVTLVGYYRLSMLMLRTFRIPLPPGVTPSFDVPS
jgi:4-carboxymuconolactone decarboxylase